MKHVSILAFAILLLVTACAVPVKPAMQRVSIPAPAMEKIPATIGLVYTEEFQSHRHVQHLPSADTYTADLEVPIGAHSAELFNQLADGMFERSVSLGSKRTDNAGAAELDGVLEPAILSVHFGEIVLAGLGMKINGLILEYGIHLYDRDGKEILSWQILSSQPATDRKVTVFGFDELAGELLEDAMRDIAAQFYAEFPSRPEVAAWLGKLREDASGH